MDNLTENELSYIIRGSIIKVYRSLGPGLLESVYEMALAYELKKEGCDVELQQPVPVWYDGVKLDCGFRLDILVNNSVIIEIKSIENLAEVHHKQILTYLKLADKRLGILVNFNTEDIFKGIHRKANQLK